MQDQGTIPFVSSGGGGREVVRPTRVAAALVAAFIISLTSPALPASAQTSSVGSGYTWENGQKCAATDSEISRGSHGGGQTRGHVLLTKEEFVPYIGQLRACGQDYLRPPGYIAVDPDLWVWNGSAWAFCIGQDFHYNSTENARLSRTIGHSKPCGVGYYAANTYGGTYFDAAWRGGRMWSGHIYIG